jgi:hypothetical protein
MNRAGGAFFIIGTLFLLSESYRTVAIVFYTGSYFLFLSDIFYTTEKAPQGKTTSNKNRVPSKHITSKCRKQSNKVDDSQFFIPTVGAFVAGNILSSDDVATTSSTVPDGMDINPATGLPMIGGIGGIDAEGNMYGSGSMSGMSNFIDDDLLLSDDLSSSDSCFDPFDSSTNIGCDDSFSSFDDSFSSNDDW